ncbi:SWIM zinc finger family protein [Halovenus aranensis]|uniref:SWIM zinc finger family protein n=1 Tax=Halovenus aranensis TaxID=890420 RepID=UPI001FE02198|nr:SWIM zinc finger family protein [Halovenus aranensis]
MSTIEWSADTGPVDERIGEPPTLRFPDGFEYTESWKRAQTESDQGGPINDAERMVYLEESSKPHRVVFVLDGARLRADCGCAGYHHRQWCAHVASLWWQWVRGRIQVTHRQTGREHEMPPCWLRFGDERHDVREDHLDGLTSAELDAYLTCDLGETGVREYARKTSRAPGTVGNLLSRARQKVEDGVAVTDGGHR